MALLMHKNKTWLIGLTGPAAAGKDEVAKSLKSLGVYIINVDKLAHQLYRPRTALWRKLVLTFGQAIIGEGDKINRQKLGQIVFADKRKLKLLNKLVHPQLKAAVSERIKRASHKRVVVVNAAILNELGLVKKVDMVWVVLAPQRHRLRRLRKKGLTLLQANNVINSQVRQSQFSRQADIIIRNSGSLLVLKEQSRKLLKNM